MGVGVDLDARYLREDYHVFVKGTLDLRWMAVLAKCQPGTLAKMSEDYVKLKLDKEGTMFSNWDAHKLSSKQIEYAAKDVEAAIRLFKYFLNHMYDGWMPRSEENKVKYVIDEFCAKFLDSFYDGSRGIPYDVIRQRLPNVRF